MSNPLSRQHFIPPALDSCVPQLISDKSVADVVEAIIGASYLTGGEPAASKSIYFFLGDKCKINWTAYYFSWLKHALPTPKLESSIIVNCRNVESIIGYKFNDLTVLAQALTHPSAIISGGNSYERLEFLGDSILGFIVTTFIYKLQPELAPGPLSDLRSELVHNQFLGSVSCSLGLPRMLDHMSTELGRSLSVWTAKFMAKLEETNGIIEKKNQNLDASILMFWNHLETAPKTLGDIFESVVGAVFLDSGFQIEPIEGMSPSAPI